ncbi:hypothetical protein KGP26_29740 (plasmid) [Serratia sp. JSRIV002]|uniref:hypothetical protein n=1 Tax=Serratia sp. JSRIV002 TaxID=2831894 RepID=UPI001CC0C295|nr:hypothetical protein [Serratia sp. JSRIV002]UAN54733.1 hypothetical protein KGP26_29740 [Serratia sp. JSRIV002]
MIISTEKLKQRIDRLRKQAADVKWVSAHGAQEMLEVADALGELLAVREAATPIYQIWDDGRWYDAEERIWRETYNEYCENQFRIVYTAPPAPALTVNFKALAKDLVDNLVDCGAADDEVVKQYLSFAEKACRAAMLKGEKK